jgi:hypothetical protein
VLREAFLSSRSWLLRLLLLTACSPLRWLLLPELPVQGLVDRLVQSVVDAIKHIAARPIGAPPFLLRPRVV